MGWYVHLHVCFACDRNEGVAELAKKHRAIIGDECQEVAWFLDDLSSRSGSNPGPKGGLSMWGIIGNYTNADEFVSVLSPFWLELLTGDVDGGPCDHEHILVFEEQEQRERASAIEIYKDDGGNLVIKKHECPFAWMQF